MTENRFDRNILLFGEDGQRKLANSKVIVMGAGGLGSQLIAQLALLGVGKITVIDKECIELSNRNRYLGVWHNDPIPGSKKVDLAHRHVKLIDNNIDVTSIHENIISMKAIQEIKRHDYIIGCVDHDGVRYFLNEVCLAFSKPYIDLASEIHSNEYGGRVKIVNENFGCLLCTDGLLDMSEVDDLLLSQETKDARAGAYGFETKSFDTPGPSVVSINGLIASLGVTAFMTLVTVDKIEYDFLNYRGVAGIVTRRKDTKNRCTFCVDKRNKYDTIDFSKYFINKKSSV